MYARPSSPKFFSSRSAKSAFQKRDFELIQQNMYSMLPSHRAFHPRYNTVHQALPPVVKELINTTCTCTSGSCQTDDCTYFKDGFECGPRCPRGKKCKNKVLACQAFPSTELGVPSQDELGLYAGQYILKDTIIGEYTGVAISTSNKELKKFLAAERNEKRMAAQYLKKLSDLVSLDARNFGSKMAFINHSCDPNAEFRERFGPDGSVHIIVVSTKPIEFKTEITVNYGHQEGNFHTLEPPTQCLCKSANCVGFVELGGQKMNLALVADAACYIKGTIAAKLNKNKMANPGKYWPRKNDTQIHPSIPLAGKRCQLCFYNNLNNEKTANDNEQFDVIDAEEGKASTDTLLYVTRCLVCNVNLCYECNFVWHENVPHPNTFALNPRSFRMMDEDDEMETNHGMEVEENTVAAAVAAINVVNDVNANTAATANVVTPNHTSEASEENSTDNLSLNTFMVEEDDYDKLLSDLDTSIFQD